MAVPQITVDRESNKKLVIRTDSLEMMCPLPTGLTFREDDTGYVRLYGKDVTGGLRQQDILQDFIIGLSTSPEAQARRFIQHFGPEFWITRLGQLSTEFDISQVTEICACVDAVGQVYREILQEGTTALALWDFPPVESSPSASVIVLAVAEWIWPLMRRFAGEFSYGSGPLPWHIFDSNLEAIVIRQDPLWRSASLRPLSDNPFVPNGYVSLVYDVSDLFLEEMSEHSGVSWRDRIGPGGIWTASYMEKWLIEQFIPKVLSQYQASTVLFPRPRREQLVGWIAPDILACYREHHHQGEQLFLRKYYTHFSPLFSLVVVDQLVPYLLALQQWFNTYPTEYFPAELLRDYYRVMADIARSADPAALRLEDLREELYLPSPQKNSSEEGRSAPISYDLILHLLDLHVKRVMEIGFEARRQADLVSRAFLTIVRDGHLEVTSQQLGFAGQAIAPLWSQRRFEKRYCATFGRE